MSTLSQLRAKRATQSSGFSLVELAIYIAIVAVILAIAIPQFIGFRARTVDRSAQASDRTAVLAARAAATDQGDSYVGTANLDPDTGLPSEEAGVNFVAGDEASTGTDTVSILDGDNFIVTAAQGSDRCWYMRDQLDAGDVMSGTWYAVSEDEDCTAATAPAVNTGTGGDWENSWPGRG